MGGAQLPAELGGRPQPSKCLADCRLAVHPFGLERRYRIVQMVGELGANLGDIGRRQGKLARHSVEVGGDRVGAAGVGADWGAEVSRPGAQTAFSAANEGNGRDQEGAPAGQPQGGVEPVDGHRFAPPTARPMPSENAAHSWAWSSSIPRPAFVIL